MIEQVLALPRLRDALILLSVLDLLPFAASAERCPCSVTSVSETSEMGSSTSAKEESGSIVMPFSAR